MTALNPNALPVLAGLLALAVSTAPFADCVDGTREATAREQEFHDRTKAALRDALPPAPPNWEVKLPDLKPARLGLCGGTKEGEFETAVYAKYTYRPPKDEADRILAEHRKTSAEIASLETLPPEVQAERKALLERYGEATRAARQAEKEGDKELAKRKYAERDDFNRQSNDLRLRHLEKVKPQVDPLKAKLATLRYGPQEFTVKATANERFPRDPQKGHGAAVDVGTVPAPRSPGLRVHGVRVVVEGPAPRCEELAAAVDKGRMRALLR